MSKFVITYYGYPNFDRPEQGKEYMGQWRAWMATLGAGLINPGSPMKPGKTVDKVLVSDTDRGAPLTGFSIIEAASMEEAVEMAKGCPHLDHGTIDIAEAMDMSMT